MPRWAAGMRPTGSTSKTVGGDVAVNWNACAGAVRWVGSTVRDRLDQAIAVVLGFFRYDGKESSTRLCAIICCVVGAAIGIGAVRIALHNATNVAAAEMVKALAFLATVFVANGCVAIISRSKCSGVSGGAQDAAPLTSTPQASGKPDVG